MRGSDEVMKAVLEETGVSEVGGTSTDGKFTVIEVECAGACVNAPVFAVNDDYYVGDGDGDLCPPTNLLIY